MASLPQLPPGPKGLPYIGIMHKMLDPLAFFQEAATTHGDIVYLDFGSNHAFLLNNPDHIKWVLQDNNRNYSKGVKLEIAKQVLGNGLAVNDGPTWLVQRRLMQPAFHRQRIGEISQRIGTAAEEWLEAEQTRWLHNGVTDINQAMYRLAAQVVFKAIFGSSIPHGSKSGRSSDADVDELVAAWGTILTTFNRKSFAPIQLPMHWPTPSHRRYHRAFALLNGTVKRIIDERRSSGADGSDLLSLLLAAQDEETGSAMSDEQLRDEVMTMFLASHETTANTLVFALYLLSQHPETLSWLHEEWKGSLSGRTPTFEDLPRLRLTRAVIEETLRLYPPAWLIYRAPFKDDEIGGYPLAAGNMVMISPYVLQRDEQYWSQPNAFKPDRFLDPETKTNAPFTYFPFGGGPRRCIGDQFAMTEMMLVLPMLLQQFNLNPISPKPLKVKASVTLQVKDSLRMAVSPRVAPS